ncbi:DUF1295 domain-containing protein [Natronoglycomyces albus]|uniref:DUF1295 domain-containing protein n=1 Tax=Natronoglycomyces albus TaxID=2811108 RepID=A0A895XW10_9ACTN|nr:DUF1295 domain-containing protein [Natronoglycomyces albus]QSB06410.1 DUF1295 domain-containing protein [Natronoglycomyces albus]
MDNWGPLLLNLGVTAAVSLGVLLLTFAVAVATGKHRVVDVAWGLAFAIVAFTTWWMSAGHGDDLTRAVVTTATIVWGLRLATHIAWRSRGKPEDPRYEEMLSKAKGNRNVYALRWVYVLQGSLVWFISWPVQVAQYAAAPPLALLWLGVAIWLLGFVFESVGDYQLAAFKNNPANKGKVLQSGLWRYTRHPNYFGDACVWWGLFVMACGSWVGAATIVAPLTMTYFLAAKTGKPLMEEHLSRTRPEYVDYINRTSGFVPLPPKSSSGRT